MAKSENRPETEAPATDISAMRQQMETMRAELDRMVKLLGQGTEGQESPADKVHRAWAQLSAKQKTEIVVAERFPPKHGTQPFQVVHTTADGKLTECFPLVINAHSNYEAEAFYRDVMGIRNTDGKFQVTPQAA